MYVKNKYPDGRTILAVSTAPPADPQLQSELRELSNAHLTVAGDIPFGAIADVLDRASYEQIERGRLQMLHALNETDEAMLEYEHDTDVMYRSAIEENGLPGLTMITLDRIASDISDLEAKCVAGYTRKRAQAWGQALRLFREGMLFADKLSETVDTVTSVNVANSSFTRYASMRSTYKKFCETVRQSGAGNDMLDIEDIEQTARSAINEQLRQPYKPMLYDEVERLRIMCGSKDILWTAVQDEERRDEWEKQGIYRPLAKAEADMLREGVPRYLRQFDGLQEQGFVPILRSIQTALLHGANRLNSDWQNEASARAAVARAYGKSSEMEKQAAVDNVPVRRASAMGTSAARLACAQAIDDGLSAVQRAQGISLLPELHISVDPESGVIVGGLTTDPSRILLVYPIDPEDRTYQGGILATYVPASFIEAGVPPLGTDIFELLQKVPRDQVKMSNFYSVNSFLYDMQVERIQEYILGQEARIVDHRQAPPVDDDNEQAKGHNAPVAA